MTTDVAWERFGALDPYYGVLTHERFHSDRLDEQARADFFQSGRDHIDSVFSRIEELFGERPRPAFALDYGCGVGRLVLALAPLCGRVVGVDVSPSMLEEAGRNARELGYSNVSCVSVHRGLDAMPAGYDFVHSALVFQHISARRGYGIIDRLARDLAPGGYGMVHVTTGWASWLAPARELGKRIPVVRAIGNLARGRRLDFPYCEMHRYELTRVMGILRERGAERVEVDSSPYSGFHNARIFFRKGR